MARSPLLVFSLAFGPEPLGRGGLDAEPCRMVLEVGLALPAWVRVGGDFPPGCWAQVVRHGPPAAEGKYVVSGLAMCGLCRWILRLFGGERTVYGCKLYHDCVSDCRPFAEFILSEAEGLRASAYSVARNDNDTSFSVFELVARRAVEVLSEPKVKHGFWWRPQADASGAPQRSGGCGPGRSASARGG